MYNYINLDVYFIKNTRVETYVYKLNKYIFQEQIFILLLISVLFLEAHLIFSLRRPNLKFLFSILHFI